MIADEFPPVPAPCDDPPPPERCPTCGRPWDGFHLGASGVLEWLETLEHDTRHLRRYVELLTIEESLP